MKHTDFDTIYKDLKKNEMAELVEAVKAHHGKLVFKTGEENWLDWNAPVIIVNLDTGPVDVVITEVSIAHGRPVIKGFDKEDVTTSVVEVDSADILPGQVSFIIDEIPETKKVKTVTAFNDGPVNVTCYGKTQSFPSRHAAIDFFWEVVINCEGAERDRYIEILIQLKNGWTNVSDSTRPKTVNIDLANFVHDLGERYPEVSFAKLTRITKAAYDYGEAKALKDLPGWEKDGIPVGSAAVDVSGLGEYDFIRRNGKLLRISSLEKLPGFKED